MKREVTAIVFVIVLISFFTLHTAHSQSLNQSNDSIKYKDLFRVSLLSIHVSSAGIHDSVFHFLTDKLGLPVDYYPTVYAGRSYAAVFAGNMYLEPCGPFTTFNYARKNFKAIFFGLNCESKLPVSSLAKNLGDKNIRIEKSNVVLVTDSQLIKPNIYFNIVPAANKKAVSGNSKEDSLHFLLRNNKIGPGIEKIKEIQVGYTNEQDLEKWKNLIYPSVLSSTGLWEIGEGPAVRLIKDPIREVQGITFKVKSLKKAKSFFIANNLAGHTRKDEIVLDPSKTYGLSLRFTEH